MQCDSENTEGWIKIATWDVSQTLQLSVFVIKTNRKQRRSINRLFPVAIGEEEFCSDTWTFVILILYRFFFFACLHWHVTWHEMNSLDFKNFSCSCLVAHYVWSHLSCFTTQSNAECRKLYGGGGWKSIYAIKYQFNALTDLVAVTSSCSRQSKSQHIADSGEAAIIVNYLWNPITY